MCALSGDQKGWLPPSDPAIALGVTSPMSRTNTTFSPLLLVAEKAILEPSGEMARPVPVVNLVPSAATTEKRAMRVAAGRRLLASREVGNIGFAHFHSAAGLAGANNTGAHILADESRGAVPSPARRGTA